MRGSLAILLVTAVAALVGGGVYWWVSRSETIAVTVDGTTQRVPAGTTLDRAAARLGVSPQPGSLLDVEGAVLRPEVYPGWWLLNGRRAPGASKLRDGDRIRAVDGPNRREPTVSQRQRLRGGNVGNPEFNLVSVPGVEEIVRGKLSGKLVSSTFVSTGAARVPRAVALTFDDGPSPYTPKILAILRRLRAKATFFVVGYEVAARPDLLRREVAAGMGVGNHSYSHPYRPPFEDQPHVRIRREIEEGAAAIERAAGVRPKLFRPPGGTYSPYVIEATGAVGERIVLWSVDPTDWQPGITARQITRNVLGAVKPGSIVIMHDGGGDRSQTVKALPAIIRGIRKRGLRLVLVDSGSAPATS